MLLQGVDSKGRVQSKYSASHAARQAAAKFKRVSKIVKKYPEIVETFKADMNEDDNSACAALVAVTGMRPGSTADTGAESKSYGATTLLAKHVGKDKEGIFLKFVPGKKQGKEITIRLQDEDVATALWNRASKAKPNDRLFAVSAQSLRDKVKQVAGCKTKDLRTAVGTMTAIQQIKKAEAPATFKAYKAQVREVSKVVSDKLGNTPAVALSAYIDPVVFSKWRKPEWKEAK